MAVKFEPRSYLLDPTLFGRHLEAAWCPLSSGGEPRVAAAFFQHQVSCAVRARMDENSETLEDLAARVGATPETLSRKLTGAVPARIDDLFGLVLAYGDITIMPAPGSVADLLPQRPTGSQ